MKAPGLDNPGYVWTISAVAALGGLPFGYDWVVIGGAKRFYEKFFQLRSEELIGWANSCALIGCLAGSVVSGAMSDRCGRASPRHSPDQRVSLRPSKALFGLLA